MRSFLKQKWELWVYLLGSFITIFLVSFFRYHTPLITALLEALIISLVTGVVWSSIRPVFHSRKMHVWFLHQKRETKIESGVPQGENKLKIL